MLVDHKLSIIVSPYPLMEIKTINKNEIRAVFYAHIYSYEAYDGLLSPQWTLALSKPEMEPHKKTYIHEKTKPESRNMQQ